MAVVFQPLVGTCHTFRLYRCVCECVCTMTYDQNITLAHPISEVRCCLMGEPRGASPKVVAQEKWILTISVGVQCTRRCSDTSRKPYIHDNNIPFLKVS